MVALTCLAASAMSAKNVEAPIISAPPLLFRRTERGRGDGTGEAFTGGRDCRPGTRARRRCSGSSGRAVASDRRAVRDDAVSPLALRAIERVVGGAHQAVGRGAVGR